MVRRGVELIRAIVISPELVVLLLALGGMLVVPGLEVMIGSFVAKLSTTERFWVPGGFLALFIFSLNKATAVLKPSDAATAEALKGWQGFYLLEKRVKATLIWTGGALLSVAYLILAGMTWEPTLIGRWLLATAAISIFAAYSIWNAELVLHRIVATVSSQND